MVRIEKKSLRVMMTKFHILFLTALIPLTANSTSSMLGMSVEGFFDYDNYTDIIECNDYFEEVYNYSCYVHLKDKTVPFLIENNYNSSYLSILKTKKKGEILIEVGNADAEGSYYFKYEEDKEHWFLDNFIVNKKSNSPEDDYEPIREHNPVFRWRIDKKAIDISGKESLISLYETISDIYNNKEDNNISPFHATSKTDLIQAIIYYIPINDLKISRKNIEKYNNLAFFFEELGLYEQAVTILNQVINFNPERTVAHLNLADTYWKNNQKKLAKKSYQTYINLHKKTGVKNKIPNRVYERTTPSNQ